MPVIEGADLTTVSTTREPLAEGDYKLLITTSEFDESKTKIIIKTKVEDGPDGMVGKEFWDWCQVSGEWGHIGLQQIKRYLEAVFGKGTPEAESSPPDTDPLHGHSVRAYLTIESYQKNGEEQKNNRAKRIRAA